MTTEITKHAYERMQERGLLEYHKFITHIVERMNAMLNEKSLRVRVGDLGIVAAKRGETTKVVTVWQIEK